MWKLLPLNQKKVNQSFFETSFLDPFGYKAENKQKHNGNVTSSQ